jgi:hypothetical protein
MTTPRRDLLLRIAAGCALAALGMMAWALVDPSPLAMVFSMSGGQALGTVSFLVWGFVAFTDIRVAIKARRSSLPPPPRVSLTPSPPEPRGPP